MKKLDIEIWSDVMCPWCLIGWGQLSKALAELDGEIGANIVWRPFELNPSMPPEGEEQGAHIQRKYGRTAEQSAGIREHMRQVAENARVSLDYSGEEPAPPAMMRNTRRAHMLLAWALRTAGAGKQTELKLALFRAHFNERRDVGDPGVLLDIAAGTGLDRDAAAAALDDPALEVEVAAEERKAFDMNITGVPAMIVEGKFMIPGAQVPETYVNALRRVAEKTAA